MTAESEGLKDMMKQHYALFGILGSVIPYLVIIISILSSPWFSWSTNALSDLGHSVNSQYAPVFNFGLYLAGFLILLYSITIFRVHGKNSSYCLLASAFLLQLVAIFDEVYGSLHLVISILFFLSLGLASVVYALEKKSILAWIATIIGLISWILYFTRIFNTGIGVPEMISSLAVISWVVLSALRILYSQ